MGKTLQKILCNLRSIINCLHFLFNSIHIFCSLGFVVLVLQNKEAVQNSAGNVVHQFSAVCLLKKRALVVQNFPLGSRF